METITNINAIGAAASAIGSSIITAFFTRRKTKRENVNIDLESISQAVNIWKQIADGLKEEVMELRTQTTLLTEQVDNLRQENQALKNKKI